MIKPLWNADLNTTLVKVQLKAGSRRKKDGTHLNTTLVKVQ